MPAPTYDSWVPQFTLWSADGTTLLYTFTAVQNTNVPQNPQDTVIITNFRSSGAVVISGGNKPFEAFMEFFIFGDNVYASVISSIDNLYSIITINTPYLLRIDKAPGTYYQYNVKRIVDFEWQNITSDFRQWKQQVTIKLLANCW